MGKLSCFDFRPKQRDTPDRGIKSKCGFSAGMKFGASVNLDCARRGRLADTYPFAVG
jgi:hypothetical protein